MKKGPNAPKRPLVQKPLDRLPARHGELLDQHFAGLPGLYVRSLLDQASNAQKSDFARNSAHARHKDGNKVKAKAKRHYLKNWQRYPSNKAAACDLHTLFGKATIRTYENWVSRWRSEMGHAAL